MLQISCKLTWSVSAFNVLSTVLELLLQKSSALWLIWQPGCLRYPRASQVPLTSKSDL